MQSQKGYSVAKRPGNSRTSGGQGRRWLRQPKTGAEDRATLASDPTPTPGEIGMGRLTLSRPPSHSFPTKALNALSQNQRLDE